MLVYLLHYNDGNTYVKTHEVDPGNFVGNKDEPLCYQYLH